MPVRFEDHTPPTRPQTDASTGEPGGRGRGSMGRWLIAGLFVVLLVAVIIGALNVRGERNDPGAAPSATGPTAPVELPVGQAAEGLGATDNIVGVPAGFPQTVDGAVSAALTWDNAVSASYFQPVAVRERLAERIYTAEAQQLDPLGDEVAQQVREGLGVDASGNGTDQPLLHAYSKRLWKYGAYRVDDVQPSQDAPTEVTVSAWAPSLTGLGAPSALDDVEVFWGQKQFTLRWSGSDWQIADGQQVTEQPPAPDEPGEPWVTFTERARLLGAGWQMTADASDQEDPSVYDEGWVQ